MAGQKKTIYLPEELLEELKREAERQDRSFSWLLQEAWLISRGQIKSWRGAHRARLNAPVVDERKQT